ERICGCEGVEDGAAAGAVAASAAFGAAALGWGAGAAAGLAAGAFAAGALAAFSAGAAAGDSCGSVGFTGEGRAWRPSRWALPITALRETPPSSSAIWLAVTPWLHSSFRRSMRSSVQDILLSSSAVLGRLAGHSVCD